MIAQRPVICGWRGEGEIELPEIDEFEWDRECVRVIIIIIIKSRTVEGYGLLRNCKWADGVVRTGVKGERGMGHHRRQRKSLGCIISRSDQRRGLPSPLAVWTLTGRTDPAYPRRRDEARGR